jgi:hypothetical protein
VNEIIDEPEGWYLDPYGLHEQRWFSAGRPTALVRDHGVDGHDAPPDHPPPAPPQPVPEVEVRGYRDDEAEDRAHQTISAAFGNIGVQP